MRYQINLLEKKEASLTERLVYFSLNYLRYIVVITQLVVISVFFYRFQIDQKIIDLKESVDQKKEIVQVATPLFSAAEIINKKETEIQNIFNSQQKINTMVQYFLSIFPEGIILESLEIEENSIKAVGTVFNPRQLQSFLALLKKEKKFELVDLTSIKKTDSGYSFSLSLSQFYD